jgi:glycosyltransferase involved in cell wall biosynthesis
VAGDFTPLGGMDSANHALARHLSADHDVHLVTHRVWPDLHDRPRVSVHLVRRPLGSHALGGALLARAGTRVWKRLQPLGARIVVNGGNCRVPDAINWVHYVHAAYRPALAASAASRAKSTLTRRHDLAAERAALRDARIVICNSRRTQADVIERVGVEPSRATIVYYGSDPVRFSLVDGAARAAARHALASVGVDAGRPLVGFVGALGDRRKAFDTLFAAWSELCRDRAWDANLLVVGAGGELASWRRRIAAAGLAERITFTGFRRDVPEMIAALDLLVHPARYEAYGLAVHEAICRGVPALVSASAGVAERFPCELADLLIANVDDAHELADRLRLWADARDRFQSAVLPLSDALRARTWDVMAREIAASSREWP